MADENFLSRWSRRKTQAKAPDRADRPAAADLPAVAAPAAAPAPGTIPAAPAEPVPLPAVESLTTESDFAPFMAPEVDGDLRRKALKTLFTDPHFNVMDMMDVYVDDYSKPDPLPASWLDKLEQVSRLGDRAGRDREEAERRRAQEEAAQAPSAAPDASPAPETAAGAAPDALPEPAGDALPPEAAIPPQGSGESGT
jgi:hypothetical protein